MPVVHDTETDAAGVARPDTLVTVLLYASADGRSPGLNPTTEVTLFAPVRPMLDEDGNWSVELEPNANLLPDGNVYVVVRQVPGLPATAPQAFVVPDTAGPFWVGDLLTDMPATLASSALLLEVARAEAAEAAHVAANPAHSAAHVSVSSGAGVTSPNVQAAIAEIVGFINSQEAGDSAAIAALATSLASEITRATTQEALKLAKAANLSDLANAATARTNLGLGTAATHPATDFDASGAAAAVISDSAYDATAWDGDTTHSPSKNAIRDKIETLGSGGGLSLSPTAVKTGAYTAAPSDLVPVDTTAGAVTITLPAAPADKSVIVVKHVIQGGANTVTVTRGGSDVFNKAGGSTSLTLTLVNQALLVQYKASTGIWYVIADDLALSQLDGRYVTYVGTATAPITNPAQARPSTSGPVYWVMDVGIVPANAIDGDMIWTKNGPTTITSDGTVAKIVKLTQAAYNALSPDSATMYWIVG